MSINTLCPFFSALFSFFFSALCLFSLFVLSFFIFFYCWRIDFSDSLSCHTFLWLSLLFSSFVVVLFSSRMPINSLEVDLFCFSVLSYFTRSFPLLSSGNKYIVSSKDSINYFFLLAIFFALLSPILSFFFFIIILLVLLFLLFFVFCF